MGPALGPIRFLEKASGGWVPRPAEELNAMLGWTFGHPVNCEGLISGLQTIAKALNTGEIARAMIATQFLHLPTLDEAEAKRAASVVALFKAAPDTPGHPGWPAGTPGGRGGKFMPKDGSLEDLEELKVQLPDARRMLATNIERKIIRAAIRTVLRRLLTFKRISRLLGEVASNLVPGLDAIGDAAMVYDVAEMAGDMAELRRLAVIARAWAQHGPYTLDELLATSEVRAFSSFSEFKKLDVEKYFPNAGIGFEFHHIIPQASSLPGQLLNSTQNIIRLPTFIHQMATEEWARLARENGLSLGDYLKGMSAAEQRRIGLKILRDLGVLK
jgi:hypothetical protein